MIKYDTSVLHISPNIMHPNVQFNADYLYFNTKYKYFTRAYIKTNTSRYVFTKLFLHTCFFYPNFKIHVQIYIAILSQIKCQGK